MEEERKSKNGGKKRKAKINYFDVALFLILIFFFLTC